MRDDHIIDILERVPFASLSEDERSRIESHAGGCAACLRAYEAARLAADLLEARAGEQFEPPPFFQTRVMAALRERQAGAEGNALERMWRAARVLVSAMAIVVVLLAGATYLTSRPQTKTVAPEIAVGQTLYSQEWDVLEGSDATGGDISDDQMIAIMYDSEDVYGQGR